MKMKDLKEGDTVKWGPYLVKVVRVGGTFPPSVKITTPMGQRYVKPRELAPFAGKVSP